MWQQFGNPLCTVILGIILMIPAGCKQRHPLPGGPVSMLTNMPMEQVVLVRKGRAVGAFIASAPTSIPGPATYRWIWRGDGGGVLSEREEACTSGKGRITHDRVAFGPFVLYVTDYYDGRVKLTYPRGPGEPDRPDDVSFAVTTERTWDNLNALDNRFEYRTHPPTSP